MPGWRSGVPPNVRLKAEKPSHAGSAVGSSASTTPHRSRAADAIGRHPALESGHHGVRAIGVLVRRVAERGAVEVVGPVRHAWHRHAGDRDAADPCKAEVPAVAGGRGGGERRRGTPGSGHGTPHARRSPRAAHGTPRAPPGRRRGGSRRSTPSRSLRLDRRRASACHEAMSASPPSARSTIRVVGACRSSVAVQPVGLEPGAISPSSSPVPRGSSFTTIARSTRPTWRRPSRSEPSRRSASSASRSQIGPCATYADAAPHAGLSHERLRDAADAAIDRLSEDAGRRLPGERAAFAPVPALERVRLVPARGRTHPSGSGPSPAPPRRVRRRRPARSSYVRHQSSLATRRRPPRRSRRRCAMPYAGSATRSSASTEARSGRSRAPT